MPLNPINGTDFLAAAFQKINANDQYLDGQVAALDGDLTIEAAARQAADTALSARITSLEQDPDVRRFDYDPVNSDGLNFAFFGGRYEDLNGVSHYVSDGTVAIASGTNYIELDYATGVVSSNQVGFTDGRLKLWVAASDGLAIVGNPTDFRPQQIQPGVTIGFGYNAIGSSGLNYAYRSGWVRSVSGMVTVPGGTVLLADGAVNYVEVDSAGAVTANTVGWTSGLAPIAEVLTSGGAIVGVDDSVRGALITSIGGGSGGGGFFDAATWMMA